MWATTACLVLGAEDRPSAAPAPARTAPSAPSSSSADIGGARTQLVVAGWRRSPGTAPLADDARALADGARARRVARMVHRTAQRRSSVRRGGGDAPHHPGARRRRARSLQRRVVDAIHASSGMRSTPSPHAGAEGAGRRRSEHRRARRSKICPRSSARTGARTRASSRSSARPRRRRRRQRRVGSSQLDQVRAQEAAAEVAAARREAMRQAVGASTSRRRCAAGGSSGRPTWRRRREVEQPATRSGGSAWRTRRSPTRASTRATTRAARSRPRWRRRARGTSGCSRRWPSGSARSRSRST